MDDKLEKQLVRKYPDLYRGVNLPITQNLMPFGFECGDGWFSLVNALSEFITHHDPSIMATQVKEKFGRLRFYINGSSDFVFGALEFAEYLSGFICEECGKPGKLRIRGSWLKTLCDSCKIQLGYDDYKSRKENE